MRSRVVAIGLDATDPGLLVKWMDQGLLPHCAELRRQGAFGLVQNVRYYRTETSWLTFLTGALPTQTGEWGHIAYTPGDYGIDEGSAYEFAQLAPFYARLPGRRVCVLDPPLARPVDGVDGLQVLGWGTEVNQCLRVSRPESLMRELIERHGEHPLFENAARSRPGEGHPEVLSYRIPSSYEVGALEALSERLCVGAARRGRIMRDLASRADWDFFLGVFSETHTAAHLLWHLSQEHPLRERLQSQLAGDPMLRVFQAVDRALGDFVAALRDDSHLALFSIYGIGANVLDLPSMAFLPEALFRWSFPGEAALGSAPSDRSDAHAALDHAQHWKDEVWGLVGDSARTRLESPRSQEQRGDPLAWQPANWFRPLWPEMKAFALPTYSEGLIRINVKGREGRGTIPPAQFTRTCEEVCALVQALTDGRSGRPMVREIICTRSGPFENRGTGAPADLIVLWQEEAPTDFVESARLGRIGPLPFFRTGGHSSRGFVLSCGPGVAAGARLPDIVAQDLTAFFRDQLT
jgi:predicted AlkP superfamily phosphohydrolase/phosphomutase